MNTQSTPANSFKQYVAKLRSPLGDLYVVYSSHENTLQTLLHELYFAEQYASISTSLTSYDAVLSRCAVGDMWQQHFNSYFAGSLSALYNLLTKVTLKFTRGTAFEHSVWLALKDIPTSTLWTYKDVATHIGNPKAARAVGGALSKNPLPLILPCHRVCRSDGSIGGYMGNSALGLKRKRHLLWHEGLLEPKPQLLEA